MRLYDSAGTQVIGKAPTTPASIAASLQQHREQQNRYNTTKLKQSRNYYRGEDTKNPYDYKSYKFNLETAWNPVNNYVYGPTINSVYNQQQDKDDVTHKKLERILNINNINERRDKERGRDRGKHKDNDDDDRNTGYIKMRPEKPTNRKLLGEFYDNQSPKLCDHAIHEYNSDSIKKRTCSPLESYVSAGRDMVRNLILYLSFNLKTLSQFFSNRNWNFILQLEQLYIHTHFH
jgi:hypothetical protein